MSLHLSKWDKFLEEVFRDKKNTEPKMFIYKGIIYRYVNGKYKPKIPKELLDIFRKAI